MAKASKKSAPKKAKKAAPKAKAKPAKAKKEAKKVAPKVKAVKKAASVKPAKKVEARPAISKAAPAKAKKGAKEEVVESKKSTAPNMNMQLNIFPIISQRPIAHKPSKVAVVNEDKTRYSDEELKEFETLIIKKLNNTVTSSSGDIWPNDDI